MNQVRGLCLFLLFVLGATVTYAQTITTVAGGGTGDHIPATAASIYSPVKIARDRHGNLYIAEAGNSRIRKIDTAGIITTIAGTGAAGYNGESIAATVANLNNPLDVAVDTAGNIYIADQNNHRIRKVLPSGIILTIAGNGTAGFGGDGGAATAAMLYMPTGIRLDRLGNLYIADQGNQRIRKVDVHGIITTIAGGGNVIGDNLPATVAAVVFPHGIAFDNHGNTYIAEESQHRVRKIDSRGIITTIAGLGGYGWYNGDGILATNAALNVPAQVAVDSRGNIFISDFDNNRIRKIDTSGIITTIAGTGYGGYSGDTVIATASPINNPLGIITDANGNVYFADRGSGRIRKIDTAGMMITIAGSGSDVADSIIATSAVLHTPNSIALDAYGNLYIAESEARKIRKIDTAGIITTVAGNGTYGTTTDSVAATATSFLYPTGVSVDGAGNIYIADYTASKVFKVNTAGMITTFAGTGTYGFSGDSGAATAATLSYPYFVKANTDGYVYISDINNNRVRRVDSNGIITTFAGNGGSLAVGDGYSATSAYVSYPTDVTIDTLGNLYIADYSAHRIRKVDTAGIISTIAGNGNYGYTADSIAATATTLSNPIAIEIDNSGNMYIADRGNERIRKVDRGGMITTIAGNGSYGFTGDTLSATATSLYNPCGITLDETGNVYIADVGNNRVRKVDTAGNISTIAGNGTTLYDPDSVASTTIQIYLPKHIVIDSTGNLYFSSTGGSGGGIIHKVTSSGISKTICGLGTDRYRDMYYAIRRGGTFWGKEVSMAQNTIGGLALDPSQNLMFTWSNRDYYTNNYDAIAKIGSDDSLTIIYHSADYIYMPSIRNSGFFSAIAIDRHGNRYVSDQKYHVIYNVAGSGALREVAGLYNYEGYNGDRLPATSTALGIPGSIAIDNAGNIYFEDLETQRIRKIDTSGLLYTIAGNATITSSGMFAAQGYSGDGGPATAAALALSDRGGYPRYNQNGGIVVDSLGYVYFSDVFNHCVRQIAPNGIITTIAGTPEHSGYGGDGGNATSARLNTPRGLALDRNGYLYIADYGNNRIRKVKLCYPAVLPAITGSDTLCVAGSATYRNDSTGGVWRSSTASVATVTTGGMLNGVAVGSDSLIYTFTNYCGLTSTISKVVQVMRSPTYIAGITGSDTLAVLNTTTYTVADAGGIWSGSDSTVATVTSGGIIRGLARGSLTISYTKTNSCGILTNSKLLTVIPAIGSFAGSDSAGFAGDNGAASRARLNGCEDVLTDNGGNVYIADTRNNRVRRVSPGGMITTVVGDGTGGYGGDGGPAGAARLNHPVGLALDDSNNLYIADAGNHCVRKVSHTTGRISTLAGDGTGGYGGDGGPAGSARLNNPTGITVDTAHNVYIADNGNHRLRKISASTGRISTLSGDGTAGYGGDGGPAGSARLNNPYDITIDASGNLVFSDAGNNVIRSISTSGTMRTIVGTSTAGYGGDGGPAGSARLNHPQGIAYDAAGNLLIADANNDRVRMVNSTGFISTIAGSGTAGYGGDGGPAGTARLNNPSGLAIDRAGNVFIADEGNNRVRKMLTCPLPDMLPIAGVSSLCARSSIMLSDTASGGMWTSATPSIASIDASGRVSGLARGTTVISYSLSNSCGTATDTRLQIVNDTPTVSPIAGVITNCIGRTDTLSDTSMGGLWRSSDTTLATISSGGAIHGRNLGRVVISYSVSNACGTTVAQRTQTIADRPVMGVIVGDTVQCVGRTVRLWDSTLSGVWYSSDARVATVSSAGIATGGARGTAVLSYSVTNVCGTSMALRTQTVNDVPTLATLTGSNVACMGSSITLSTTDTGGWWASSDTAIATVTGTGRVTPVAIGSAVISYSKSNTCGTAATTQTVFSTATPVAGSISGARAIATGGTTTYATTGSAGLWYTTTGKASINRRYGTLTAGTVAGTDTVLYIAGNGACGYDTTKYAINIVYNAGLSTAGNSVNIMLYPNPAKTVLHIDQPFEQATANITDLAGRVMLTQSLTAGSTQINVQSLPTGIYMVNLQWSTGKWVAKLVKE